MEKKVYILILNFNDGKNTIACFDSLERLDYHKYRIVLIDNSSGDDSLKEIINYLENKKYGKNNQTEKKGLLILDENEINSENGLNGLSVKTEPNEKAVIIIKNNDNYGFGKGMNTGLRLCLKRNDFDYIWLLNNDTVVDSSALKTLVAEAEKAPETGFAGSVLLYENSNIIQAVGGGRFFPLLCKAKLMYKGRDVSAVKNLGKERKERIRKTLDYIMGASLLIKKEVLSDIGLFDESYFLYAEELDMIKRGKGRGWEIAVALDSFVYHKDSAGTKNKKYLFYYYITKSNTIYVKKHYGLFFNFINFIPIIFFSLLKTRNAKNLKGVIRGYFDGIRYKKNGNGGSNGNGGG